MSYLFNSRPLTWEEYEYLIQKMDESINNPSESQPKKVASLQTLVALGVHLGPLSNELLRITWDQVVNVGSFTFKREQYRQPLVLEPDLRAIIKKNYERIQPLSKGAMILPDKTGSSQRPIAALRFNNMLKNHLEECEIEISDPNANTLRRTFALKMWKDFNGSEEIVEVLAKELRLNKGSVIRYIQE